MDPTIVDPAGWLLIENTISKLAVFVVLMIIGAFSMLLGRGVIPSLVLTGELVESYTLQRRALLVLGLISFILAIVQIARVVIQLLEILNPLYPRFGF
jgi:hypothetical protein